MRWGSRIHLYLEGRDPRLLDKETRNLYRRIIETGAKILGPLPLVVRRVGKVSSGLEDEPIHRRLFVLLSPTERTVFLLEKLSLSSSIKASIVVEEASNDGHP